MASASHCLPLFDCRAIAEVFGVFCTCTNITNSPEERGSEILFVNNPCATLAVPAGMFAFGKEFVASRELIQCTRWNDPAIARKRA